MSCVVAVVLAWPVNVLLQLVTRGIFFEAPLDPFVSLGEGALGLAFVMVSGS